MPSTAALISKPIALLSRPAASPRQPPAPLTAAPEVGWRWVAAQSPSASADRGPIRRSFLMRALCRHHWGHFMACEISEHISGYAEPLPSPHALAHASMPAPRAD